VCRVGPLHRQSISARLCARIPGGQPTTRVRPTELFKAVGQAGATTLGKAKLPNWSQRDQNLLILGIVSFGLSCLIKLVVAITSPAGAPQAISPPASTSAVDQAASR